jgi:hypothetical protein
VWPIDEPHVVFVEHHVERVQVAVEQRAPSQRQPSLLFEGGQLVKVPGGPGRERFESAGGGAAKCLPSA